MISQKLKDEKLNVIRARILKHINELLTFLDNPIVEPTNNRVERQLRPNVIMRKITFGNGSQTGVRNHTIEQCCFTVRS
ncbi:MAG: transposase [Elusimicrobia bacterium]|nr:transposase [Elusimicrobiota bacterium]